MISEKIYYYFRSTRCHVFVFGIGVLKRCQQLTGQKNTGTMHCGLCTSTMPASSFHPPDTSAHHPSLPLIPSPFFLYINHPNYSLSAQEQAVMTNPTPKLPHYHHPIPIQPALKSPHQATTTSCAARQARLASVQLTVEEEAIGRQHTKICSPVEGRIEDEDNANEQHVH
jgi:hypothetical protein